MKVNSKMGDILDEVTEIFSRTDKKKEKNSSENIYIAKIFSDKLSY